MMDSVLLQLNNEQFELKPDNKLDGRKTRQGKGFTINSNFCESYKKDLKKQGIYCPDINKATKIVGSERKEVLEIQTSLPKQIYGTNAFEVSSFDAEKFYKKLLFRLDDLGVSTSENELRHTPLRRVDFSKIIILPAYLGEVNRAIYALSGFDYKPRSDANFNKFNDGNGGTSIKFWNTTQGLVIYDVIGNLLSNGFTKSENVITDSFRAGKFKRNLVRIELSLERKDSFESVIRHNFKNTEKKRDFYLEDVMSEELARGVLLKAFDTIFNDVAVGLLSLSEMEDNRLRAYLDNLKISIKKQEKLYYWVRMATNFGISGTWEQIKLRYSGGSVANCKKEVALILQELGRIDGNIPNLIEFLRGELVRFEIIKPRGELSTCKPLLNDI